MIFQRNDGYEGNSTVSFELFAEGGQTRLKFTHQGVETFSKDIIDFVRENFVGGWKYFLNEALLGYLA
ncbi:MAG: SRPBCC domain-containing protein [Candidatus Hodarchaeales archaeon]